MAALAPWSLGAVALALLTACILESMASRQVSWLAFTGAYFGFLIPLGMAVMAADEAGAAVDGNVEVYGPEVWGCLIATNLALCWVVCPLIQVYEVAGEFTTLGRMRGVVERSNSWLCAAIMPVILVSTCLWSGRSFLACCAATAVALTNAWATGAVAILQGYGLIAVPVSFWRLARPADELAVLYASAAIIDEGRLSALNELQDIMAEVRSEMMSRSLQVWNQPLEEAFSDLQGTLEECELLICELTNGARSERNCQFGGSSSSNSRTEVPSQLQRLTEDEVRVDNLAQLHLALKQARDEAYRSAVCWDRFVLWTTWLEDVEDKEQSSPSMVEVTTTLHRSAPFAALGRLHAVRWCSHGATTFWHALRSPSLRLRSAICGAGSAILVLKPLAPHLHMSFTIGGLHRNHVGQVVSALLIMYALAVSLWSLLRMRVSGWKGLFTSKCSDSGSLLWYAAWFGRLAPTICLYMFRALDVERTGFQAAMSILEIVPICGSLPGQVFPVLLALLVTSHACDMYTRTIQLFRLESLDFKWSISARIFSEELIREGRGLIGRERRRRADERGLLELADRREPRQTIPLRVQIAHMIEEGVLPADWNSQSGG